MESSPGIFQLRRKQDHIIYSVSRIHSLLDFAWRIIMKNILRISYLILFVALLGGGVNLAAAQTTPDSQSGMGPGMMGGYGPGYGMGYGMGPGMMGGYGPGYGMGPGMMGGYGMGPGMMGWGNFRGLNLSADQKSKLTKIRQEMRAKQWAVMGKMMDAQDKLQDLYDADKEDAAAIDKQYKVIDDLRRQMVDNGVAAHNQINSILTKGQREKSRDWGRGGYGPMMWGY